VGRQPNYYKHKTDLLPPLRRWVFIKSFVAEPTSSINPVASHWPFLLLIELIYPWFLLHFFYSDLYTIGFKSEFLLVFVLQLRTSNSEKPQLNQAIIPPPAGLFYSCVPRLILKKSICHNEI